MACFLVPATEAVLTTALAHHAKSKEAANPAKSDAVPRSQQLGILNRLLWGGSALLAFEHIWHGEVTPFFPFLTAASDPASASEMLHEMATVGVGMAVLVTAVWGGAMLLLKRIRRKAIPETEAAS